jgi:dihydroneopterin aldolase
VYTEDEIRLKGMRFHTLVGLLPHEAEVPQPIELDLTVWLSLAEVGKSDSPSELLDYRALYEITEEVVGRNHHRLLEGLCERVGSRILAELPVLRVEVAARKPHAPIPGPLDYVEVVIRRSRDG